jgi:formylglycine-generating enzyme required for sulfatase activity
MQKGALFLFCLMIFNLSAQKHNGNFDADSRMKNPPWSFVWTEKRHYAIKQSEVSVDEYLTFLEDVSRDSSEAFLKKLIPSSECALFSALQTEKGFNAEVKTNPKEITWINEEKFKSDNNYPPKEKAKGFSDDAYNPYERPITGISFEQVKAYLKWCNKKFNFEEEDPWRKIRFRLPTSEEFEKLQRKSIEDCNLKDPALCKKNVEMLRNCKNAKGCALCNCAGKDTCIQNRMATAALGEGLYTVYSYNVSWIGTYNMQGNAAEMTSTKGIAKGGSYLQTASECLPEAVQRYEKPEKWLGFRIIAEVVDGMTGRSLINSLVDTAGGTKTFKPSEEGDYIFIRNTKDALGYFLFKNSNNLQDIGFPGNELGEKSLKKKQDVVEIFKAADKLGMENMLSINEKDVEKSSVSYTILEYKKNGKVYRVCWDRHIPYSNGTERGDLNKFIAGLNFWND